MYELLDCLIVHFSCSLLENIRTKPINMYTAVCEQTMGPRTSSLEPRPSLRQPTNYNAFGKNNTSHTAHHLFSLVGRRQSRETSLPPLKEIARRATDGTLRNWKHPGYSKNYKTNTT
ncbi:hypothetical protein FGIG_07462 [Fasciola gigantica]|uniref:Uncharacterized protein n=1 Tax=Fasciola gigantica TaxID=46835 RepID=A0A504YQZ7_FASGI|nr:hypothetical protein FGIG_07462 [Fasciola gigantica]